MIDFNIDTGNPIIYRDVDMVLQQIDILFDTNPGEVLGDRSFGTQYDRYLYNLKVSNESLKSHILSDLNSLNLCGFSPDVEVYYFQGSERDIAIVDIVLSKNYENYRRTYKIV